MSRDLMNELSDTFDLFEVDHEFDHKQLLMKDYESYMKRKNDDNPGSVYAEVKNGRVVWKSKSKED